MTQTKNWRAAVVACGLALVAVMTFASVPAIGAEKVLYSFKGGSDGSNPFAGLIADKAGALYGTTYFGGGGTDCQYGQGCGTVFKVAADGSEVVLHAFAGGSTDGALPHAALISDRHGNLYGTTEQEGENGAGTVFSLAPSGDTQILYSFGGGQRHEGLYPDAGVIMDASGNLFGTTSFGGIKAHCQGGSTGCGTVFELTPKKKEIVLYAFQGYGRPAASLIEDSNGNLYGTTSFPGTVFKIAPNGTGTTLHTFDGSDGLYPYGSLTMDAASNLYGTTSSYGGGSGCDGSGCGTVFKVAPDGTTTTLYVFKGGNDGNAPRSGLTFDSAGNLYGTTQYGGGTGCEGSGCGTVFRLSSKGKETVLHVFQGSDGAYPTTGTLLLKAGVLYGTAQVGGANNMGVVFSVDK